MLAADTDLAAALGRASLDHRARAALQQASAEIEAACGWPIELSTGHYVGLASEPAVWLPTLHLVSVDSVRVAGALVAAADFLPNGRVWWSTRHAGSRKVEVEFTHGHKPVPSAVVAACVDLAVARVNAPDASQVVRAETETIGAYARSLTYGSATVDPSSDPRLAPYRLPPVVG